MAGVPLATLVEGSGQKGKVPRDSHMAPAIAISMSRAVVSFTGAIPTSLAVPEVVMTIDAEVCGLLRLAPVFTLAICKGLPLLGEGLEGRAHIGSAALAKRVKVAVLRGHKAPKGASILEEFSAVSFLLDGDVRK